MGEGIIKLFRVYCVLVRAWEERKGECVRGGSEILWGRLVVSITE